MRIACQWALIIWLHIGIDLRVRNLPARAMPHLSFYSFTCSKRKDRAETLDGVWALVPERNGPND